MAVSAAVEAIGARTADVVIVDPPRTGLSPEALASVLAVKPARLIYVSCDVATLARDARKVVDAGYAIERADAFDLFPNTPHVETVVVFVK
jgi:23S rRNA (uracil1939-C5)-methyltransferase